MEGMPYFAHDQHIERAVEDAGHFCRHHNSAARQAEHHSRFQPSFAQVDSEPPSGVFAGGECHGK
jgi:hypothetical protein